MLLLSLFMIMSAKKKQKQNSAVKRIVKDSNCFDVWRVKALNLQHPYQHPSIFQYIDACSELNNNEEEEGEEKIENIFADVAVWMLRKWKIPTRYTRQENASAATLDWIFFFAFYFWYATIWIFRENLSALVKEWVQCSNFEDDDDDDERIWVKWTPVNRVNKHTYERIFIFFVRKRRKKM